MEKIRTSIKDIISPPARVVRFRQIYSLFRYFPIFSTNFHIYPYYLNKFNQYFACDWWWFMFTMNKNLLHHIRSFHETEIITYKCPECNTIYRTQYLLKYHLKGKHEIDADLADIEAYAKKMLNTRTGKIFSSIKWKNLSALSDFFYLLHSSEKNSGHKNY